MEWNPYPRPGDPHSIVTRGGISVFCVKLPQPGVAGSHSESAATETRRSRATAARVPSLELGDPGETL